MRGLTRRLRLQTGDQGKQHRSGERASRGRAILNEEPPLSKEVESILGQPSRIERTELELETQKKQIPVTRYYYEQDGKSLEVHFIDNKLVSKIPKLSGQEPANRP